MAVKKTEGGEYPAAAYAYVPDAEKPSTWKLRLWESPELKVTKAQLGRAAALSPGGFRGQRVELPSGEMARVKERIRSEYRKLGVKPEEMPQSVKMSLDDVDFATGELTYGDKRLILAAALKIDERRIDDVSDTEVFYTVREEPASGRSTYKRSYKVGNNQATLGEPVQVVKRTVYEPVIVVAQFALDGETRVAEEMVIHTGKIFEAGDYPDKNFSITEEELAEAAREFSPVENDIEHIPTILSGKLGRLVSVAAKGAELFGTVELPKWLHKVIGDNPIKVSLAWMKDTKRIAGNALVLNPRIPDAQLVAAFNAANIFDDGGATMKRKWHEKLLGLFKAKQLSEGFEDFNPDDVNFAQERQDTPPKPFPAGQPEGTGSPAADSEERGDGARFAAIEQENAGLQAAAIQSAAERFYTDALAAGRALPAEKDSLVAMFKQAVLDDNQGKTCFSASGELQEGERVKSLRALVEARPAHKLTTEELTSLKPEDLVVLSTGGNTETGKMTEQRREELLQAGEIQVPKKEGNK